MTYKGSYAIKPKQPTNLQIWVRVNLGVMAIKVYSAFLKALGLEPYYQMQFSFLSWIHIEGAGLIPLQRCSQCISPSRLGWHQRETESKENDSVYEFKQGGCPRGVMVKAMDCGIVVREFVLQLRYYVHFRANTLGKGMNPLILPAIG